MASHKMKAIPKLEGLGYIMEIVRVEYEWKPPRCDECKIFGHSCNNCPKKPSTSDTQPKAEKQKYVHDDGFQSTGCEAEFYYFGFNPFSVLEEDNGKSMDDLVDDTRKKVEAPLKKTGIWDDMDLAYMDRLEEEVEHESISTKNG
ncbi:hypothetical protein Tco_0344708 [Tanacetum coccineum]